MGLGSVAIPKPVAERLVDPRAESGDRVAPLRRVVPVAIPAGKSHWAVKAELERQPAG